MRSAVVAFGVHAVAASAEQVWWDSDGIKSGTRGSGVWSASNLFWSRDATGIRLDGAPSAPIALPWSSAGVTTLESAVWLFGSAAIQSPFIGTPSLSDDPGAHCLDFTPDVIPETAAVAVLLLPGLPCSVQRGEEPVLFRTVSIPKLF